MENVNFQKWKEKYYNKKIVDFSKYLNEKDIEILKKFGIEIKTQKYTEYEFDLIDELLILYYREPGEEIIPEIDDKYKLEEIGVSIEEFNYIIEKFRKISLDYNF